MDRDFPSTSTSSNEEARPISLTAQVVYCSTVLLAMGGLPTCLYFASGTETVGPHVGLMVTALILLTLLVLSLRALISSSRSNKLQGLRRREAARNVGDHYPLQSLDLSGTGVRNIGGMVVPPAERGDAHFQDDLGRR